MFIVTEYVALVKHVNFNSVLIYITVQSIKKCFGFS